MSEPRSAPSQAGFQRGGRGWRGRPRRGNHNGPGPRNGNGGEGSQPVPREQVMSGAGPVTGASNEAAVPSAHLGVSRGNRGGRGGLRRGRGGQRSIVVSHRAPGGPHPDDRAASSAAAAAAALSAGAPEFIPGQPVAPSSVQPKAAAPAKRKASKPVPRVMPKSSAADLPTRIHEDIQNGQYECVICTGEIVRTSRIWSCSICWTVAHLHCVRKWHTNQTKERDDNQTQNPDQPQPLGWRCPGCNSPLVDGPGSHHCWCGKDTDPKPIAGLPPHTCGQTCSKPRATCPHKCPLMCHAGPCPPCTLMGPTQPCHCGKHTSTKRCTETEYGRGWSCEEICGDLLPCGEHTCSQPCHSGLCGACEIPILSTCYCGKEEKEIPCDQRDDVLDSFNYGQLHSPQNASDGPWFEGSFLCDRVCGRKFDCGYHACQKPCHPQDESTAHCPFSPNVITHCACGKTPLALMDAEPRQSCRDPILHCDKSCGKTLPCGHTCRDKCHAVPCQFCVQVVDITCRCGRTTVESACHQGTIANPSCFRICRAQLNCGRHECGEHCCPGEKKAAERRRQKRNANDNFEAEHICLQVCGRTLKCGTHACQQLCHKGPCLACLEAVFDEISCSCGRTVLHPPLPCGARPPECRFECRRARPCGHPGVSHQCHLDDTPCPKCPFLVEKSCLCGKKTLKNQPCWFDEARCGLPCGKKLKCGVHECKKSCHRPGECEDAAVPGSHCLQQCGKARKSCEHACADQCHAPYACKEDIPCQSKTFITCPCQNRKQEVRCQATRINPWPSRELSLKCDEECLRLLRNRRLADALKIDPETHADDHIPYSDATLKLFRENVSWAQGQEREFRVFAAADEKRLRFKPMPPQQRAFLHSLAEDFGLDSESQDPEPHRHVCVFKTPRFVAAPRKTLAQCARIAKAAINVGASASSTKATRTADRQSPFNALLLKEPRFGVTIDELDQALAAEFAAIARSGPAIKFTTSYLPSDEIVIKATPTVTAAAVATSLAATPHAVETAMSSLKPTVVKTLSRLGLAKGVFLCHVDSSTNVTRREGDASTNTDGWNAVASRSRRNVPATDKMVAVEKPAPRNFLALKRFGLKQKKPVVEEVEDDWLAAAEKIEGEDEGEGENGSLGEAPEGNGEPPESKEPEGDTGDSSKGGGDKGDTLGPDLTANV
ncbi:hypothetical protein B0H63DRAFT_426179 [Podospora didyma]|uniref:R3H domain-containing protein n=1 Tax=Podospora didyma TaxID=330526 RepID=A0AAE0P6I5_9PEZI|nr:hypothetical protein B0H63DRAFT_426179 [Podospora didyma]